MTVSVRTICNGRSPEEIESALSEHLTHAQADDDMVLHRSPVCVLTVASGGYCIKEWFGRGIYDILRNLLYGSKARKAYDAARKLRKLGIPTPEPFAVAEKKDGTCYLVTRFIEEARSLQQTIDDMVLKNQYDEMHAVASAVGAAVGRLHEQGIYHGDLSTKNLMVEKQENRWKVQIIDLDNIRFWRLLTRRRWLKSLMQLNDLPAGVPFSVRRAFISAYNRHCNRTIDRIAFREVANRTSRRKEARKRRRRLHERSASAQHT